MEIKQEILFNTHSEPWDEWLNATEIILRDCGYTKYNQRLKHEDFAYWKTFYNKKNAKIYHIGLFFYDHRKYIETDPHATNISVMLVCYHLNIDHRLDLTFSGKPISLNDFEEMAVTFHNSMKKYL